MPPGSFATPPDQRYLEDYIEGSVHELGSASINQEEIIDFGRRFDPQPFHTDPQAAAGSMYGGLIASGWHTAAKMMRLFVENYLPTTASLGSPGVDELRWLKPVRPGDTLTLQVTVAKVRRSASKPDRGILTSLVELLNQEGEVVMTMLALNFIACREPA